MSAQPSKHASESWSVGKNKPVYARHEEHHVSGLAVYLNKKKHRIVYDELIAYWTLSVKETRRTPY